MGVDRYLQVDLNIPYHVITVMCAASLELKRAFGCIVIFFENISVVRFLECGVYFANWVYNCRNNVLLCEVN